MYVFLIKELRESKGISQYMLSKKANISRSYLIELEKGEKINPTFQVLYKIANILDVNIKELFYTIDDIESLKQQLEIIVNQFGTSSSEAIKINHIIDSLLSYSLSKGDI